MLILSKRISEPGGCDGSRYAFLECVGCADIDSISILKNQEAIKKLTTKKCTTVILIHTKKKATAK